MELKRKWMQLIWKKSQFEIQKKQSSLEISKVYYQIVYLQKIKKIVPVFDSLYQNF
jgi:cobalt-zinc-cadmium resistance protein CzcA